MDVILGIKLKDSTILATSKAVTRGLSVISDDDDKTRELNPHNLMAFAGEAGDSVQFAEYIQANIQLYSMRENDNELSPNATASFVRNELAKSIRSRKPYQVNVLLGGFDTKSSIPSLSWIDYLGTKVDVPYAAQGYSAFYVTALLDKHYRVDLTLEEGIELMKTCFKEVERRMPINFKGYYMKIVDVQGIQTV